MICVLCKEIVYQYSTKKIGIVCRDCNNMRRYREKEEGFFLCRICGKADSPTSWMKNVLRNNLCFSCTFWTNIKEEYDKGDKIIIDGKAYHISDEKSTSFFRGFGGTQFVIQRLDTNEIIITTNLWHNGKIPDRFKNQLPDNAKFIKEYKK